MRDNFLRVYFFIHPVYIYIYHTIKNKHFCISRSHAITNKNKFLPPSPESGKAKDANQLIVLRRLDELQNRAMIRKLIKMKPSVIQRTIFSCHERFYFQSSTQKEQGQVQQEFEGEQLQD